MVALLIRRPLPFIHFYFPCPVRYGPSNLPGQSGPYLQADFSHTVKLSKGLISPSDLMILLPHLKIDRDTMKISLIQNLLPYLPLFRPCNTLVLPSLLLQGTPQDNFSHVIHLYCLCPLILLLFHLICLCLQKIYIFL